MMIRNGSRIGSQLDKYRFSANDGSNGRQSPARAILFSGAAERNGKTMEHYRLQYAHGRKK